MALCNIRASLTPRHQGIGERGHQVVMINHSILMHTVCSAFPQEWPALLPAVEYLYHTAPQMPHGLSAHDMSAGYALASSVDKRLAPFLVPTGSVETDLAARLYQNFNELYGVFTRAAQEESARRQFRANQTRASPRVLDEGETVFRRLPRAARLPKHLFPEASTGPYLVHEQRTPQSVVLKDPSTQELVDKGANIPLDQILAGPVEASGKRCFGRRAALGRRRKT